MKEAPAVVNSLSDLLSTETKREQKTVVLPSGKHLHLRSLSAQEYTEWLAGEETDRSQRLMVASIVDKQGNLLLNFLNIPALRELNVKTHELILGAILKLNGLDRESITARKNVFSEVTSALGSSSV